MSSLREALPVTNLNAPPVPITSVTPDVLENSSPEFMSDSLSIYLDVVRFIAAFAVLVGHLDQDGMYASWLVLGDFSHAAVVVFFVLSGLVISHAAFARAGDWRAYVVARFARIYSVVVPAIALSFGIKALAAHLDPIALANEFSAVDWHLGNFFGALFFLNESWSISSDLPWNGPFWSLCYEVWYYVIFGLFLFAAKTMRWWLIAAAALVAGPAILLLFPLWLLGVWLVQHGAKLIPSLGWSRVLWVSSVLGFVALNQSGIDVELRTQLNQIVPGYWRLESAQRFITDYCLGVLVAINFIAFRGLGATAQRWMQAVKTPVVFMAGYTFSVYLYHRPLTHLLGHFVPNTSRNLLISLGALVLVVGSCLLLGHFTEQRKHYFRNLARSALHRIAPAR